MPLMRFSAYKKLVRDKPYLDDSQPVLAIDEQGSGEQKIM